MGTILISQVYWPIAVFFEENHFMLSVFHNNTTNSNAKAMVHGSMTQFLWSMVQLRVLNKTDLAIGSNQHGSIGMVHGSCENHASGGMSAWLV